MIRVAVAGAAGRMGRRVAELAAAGNGGLRLAAVWEAPGSPAVGTRIGELTVGSDPRAAIGAADVYIDFTRPKPSVEHAMIAAELGVAAVVGTTGFEKTVGETFASALARIPMVIAPNMSIGVNLMLKLAEEAARALGPDYDAEIVELHHRFKEDAPSGTAKALLDRVKFARGCGRAVTGREGLTGARKPDEVGVLSVRAGDIVGDHTLYLVGMGERIELTHRAHSRDTFALGALRAARWIVGRPAGLYAMQHVLGWA